jgi:Uma2 family endonuclease
MSPASNRHSLLQGEIQALLRLHAPGGLAFPECSVGTAAGVKVADVAWASPDFLRRHGAADPYPKAPEIVVEVLSDSNTRAEMDEKQGLYFERGAQEFWLCTQQGEMLFFDVNGPIPCSRLSPDFPARVSLPFD